MQLSFFEQTIPIGFLNDLFQAYFDARKNKRNTINALAFEVHFEKNLFLLADEIVSRNYQPKPSTCFIVDKPVKREVFAADFRDRVVHHLVFNYISPVFEGRFINDCYSCRKGKGTHYGIQRIDHFIRSCSRNYAIDCYILKLDIKGYFMSINRNLLFRKIEKELLYCRERNNFDSDMVLYLLKMIIFNDPTDKCIVKGKESDWNGLPKGKSLFTAQPLCGLPIGNLTSQLFGNIYMNDFDHFIKKDCGIGYYGRYVDDFVLVHQKIEYLKYLVPAIKQYLHDKLMLELHPDKIYLQHYSKGVRYLGAVIKPHRIYVAARTRGNFFDAIEKQNRIARNHKPNIDEKKKFMSSVNSYLGILKHYRTYKFRKNIIKNNLSGWWLNYVKTNKGVNKFLLK